MKSLQHHLQCKREQLKHLRTYLETGYVDEISGVLMTAQLKRVRIGEICSIDVGDGVVPAEVIGFRKGRCILMPFDYVDGIITETPVSPSGARFKIQCGNGLLGCVLNGLGQVMDSAGDDYEQRSPVLLDTFRDVHCAAPNPLKRRRINTPFITGVWAMDAFLTLGTGQRVGVFAGAGSGKSTLLGQIARSCGADVVVINLVGERGREVREFLEDTLGAAGRKRSVVVVATSDQPAIVRLKSAYVATTIAEYFRDSGKNVLFIMDSVTRFARALREIGLARGEPPVRAGYPPSVYAELPRLLERSGTNENGSITALYSVLVEGDDTTEPVSDEVMSLLDGHVVLSRDLAAENHYPAIDILQSKSRVMNQIVETQHLALVRKALKHYSIYMKGRDAIRFGFYEPGKNEEMDRAVALKPEIDAFLKTVKSRPTALDTVYGALHRILNTDQEVANV